MIGNLFIVAAPSGAGKTTLVSLLLENDPQIRVSISHTTRAPRPGEENGREYHFIDVPAFLEKVQHGEFLEWAEVHGNFYGTSFRAIEEALAQNKTVILDIDVQGHKSIREKFPALVTSVFVTTKNMSILKERLSSRNTETPEILEQRVINAISEMRHIDEYDYFLINDDFNDSLSALTAIASASRHKRSLAYTEGFTKAWKI